MAVSESYLAFVLEQLDDLRGLASRRMFGGVGVYSEGMFFAVIDNDTLFFKVDEALSAQYRKRRMRPFAPIPGKPPMRTYYQVPLAVLEDRDELVKWARQSLAVAAQPPARRVRR